MSKRKLSPAPPGERNSLPMGEGVGHLTLRVTALEGLSCPAVRGLCSPFCICVPHGLGEFPSCYFSHPLLDK